MKKIYVVGNKTSKSLSPLIFNHWFKKYKINARYAFVEVKKNNFKKTIEQILSNKNVIGLNITIPYKKEIIKYIGRLNKHAQLINAVNCVVNKKKPRGINTDWVGYKDVIKVHKLTKSKNIIILGYGGASQAISYYFFSTGYKNIYIFNRSKKLINKQSGRAFTKKFSGADKYLQKADLIINTTPTNPLSKKQCKIVNKKTLISDIVYRPKKTNFLKAFKGNKKIFGITMLLNQATPCFKLWFGFEPKIDKNLIKKIDKIISWL